MTPTFDKTEFDQLIGTPPPSLIDVTYLIGRERRRRRARHAGAGAAALACVAASIMLTVLPGTTGTAPPAPTAEAQDHATFRLVADDRESAAATARALSAALDRALRDAAPDSRWLEQDLFGNPAPDGQPPRLIGDDRAPRTDQMFYGGTGLAVGGRRGSLVLQVISTRPCVDASNPKCAQERNNPAREQQLRQELLMTCLPTVKDCAVSTGERGERVLAQTVTSPQGPSAAASLVTHEAKMLLSDRRVLSVLVSNEFATNGTRPTVAQPAPPINRDQALAIVTDVGRLIRP